MSPLSTPARMHDAPVFAGRALLPAGHIAASAIRTITTGTGTNGSGWVSVRR
jgi:hypothetical protein